MHCLPRSIHPVPSGDALLVCVATESYGHRFRRYKHIALRAVIPGNKFFSDQFIDLYALDLIFHSSDDAQ
jgi:hypothetical protein